MDATAATALLEKGEPLFVALFIASCALWTGTLFSVSWLSGRAQIMADGPEIGALALALLRRWTAPSALVSLAAAAAWIAASPVQRMRDPWIYGAGAALAALTLLHLGAGIRAKRVVHGSVDAARGEGMRRLAVVLSIGALIALLAFRVAAP